MSYGHDFDEIEAAVMETARGRWFLAEFATRNRVAETRLLLEAIARLEHSIGPGEAGRAAGDAAAGAAAALVGQVRDAVRQARAAFEAAGSEDGSAEGGRLAERLDRLLQKTRSATSDILNAAETIQETAWALRERGVEAASCDALDRGATAIYTASAFHDLAAGRLESVQRGIRAVEDLVDVQAVAAPAATAVAAPADAPPVPARPTQPRLRPPVSAVVADDIAFVVREPASASPSISLRPERPNGAAIPPPPPVSRQPDPAEDAAPPAADDAPDRPSRATSALAAIDGLDIRERMRLFT